MGVSQDNTTWRMLNDVTQLSTLNTRTVQMEKPAFLLDSPQPEH